MLETGMTGKVRCTRLFRAFEPLFDNASGCLAWPRMAAGIAAACLAVAVAACENLEGNVALGGAGVTLYGARTPAHEIEQIYYLGSFDPQEQLPPTIYRVRVHGQASVLSGTKFASGWVPAPVVDSLGTDFRFDFKDPNSHGVKLTKGEIDLAELDSVRRLMQFGPEGIREAPKNHRLVIVMGTSPEAFFEGINTALGRVGGLRLEQSNAGLRSKLFDDLIDLRGHQTKLNALDKTVADRIKNAEGLK